MKNENNTNQESPTIDEIPTVLAHTGSNEEESDGDGDATNGADAASHAAQIKQLNQKLQRYVVKYIFSI